MGATITLEGPLGESMEIENVESVNTAPDGSITVTTSTENDPIEIGWDWTIRDMSVDQPTIADLPENVLGGEIVEWNVDMEMMTLYVVPLNGPTARVTLRPTGVEFTGEPLPR